ncbi:hypothetical protein pb186bvf_015240 [Paramecium bursaria]
MNDYIDELNRNQIKNTGYVVDLLAEGLQQVKSNRNNYEEYVKYADKCVKLIMSNEIYEKKYKQQVVKQLQELINYTIDKKLSHQDIFYPAFYLYKHSNNILDKVLSLKVIKQLNKSQMNYDMLKSELQLHIKDINPENRLQSYLKRYLRPNWSISIKN